MRRRAPVSPFLRSRWNSQSRSQRRTNQLRPIIERLEDRRVMTITWNLIGLAAGTVVGNGVDNMPGNADDEITIALPANVLTAMQDATRLWDQFITDNITLNVEVGWGTNFASNVNAFANSPSIDQTFTAVRTALQADQSSTNDNTAFASLPAGPDFDVLINFTANNPNGSGSATTYLDNDGDLNNTNIAVKRANAKALGLLPANDATVDGRIVFNSTRTWDFNRIDGVTGFDIVGIGTHEIGHFLGFVSGVDTLDFNDGQAGRAGPFNDNQFDDTSVLDLYRFSAESIAAGGAGTIDVAADGRTKFFAIDGGTTSLGAFSEGSNNGTPGNQASHWLESSPEIGVMDPTTGSGEFDFITALDTIALDVIGWNVDAAALGNPVFNGTNGDDTFVVSINASDTSIVQIVLNGTLIAAYPIAQLDSLTLNGLEGTDSLTVDNSQGFVELAINWDGGTSAGDNDRLSITGNPFATIARETYRVGATQDAGIWIFDRDDNMGPGSGGPANGDELTVNFKNIEPVDSDTPATVFDVILAAAGDNVSIVNGGALNGFTSLQVNDLSGTFETFRFARKGTVRLMGQTGGDRFLADYTTAATGLTSLQIFGHAVPGVVGIAADDAAIDEFRVERNAAGAAVTIAGNDGSDSYVAGNGNLTLLLSTVVVDAGGGLADSMFVDDSGRAAVQNYEVDATSIRRVDGVVTSTVVTYNAALELARLGGTQGANEFLVTPSADTEFFIDGNDPSTLPGDLLEINFAGTTGRQLTKVGGDGMWEFSNREDVKFEEIESFNFFPITAIGADAGPNSRSAVRVYDAELGDLVSKFFAYGTSFKGGVRIAVGDITGDGIPEIITAPGAGRSPLVKVFDVLSSTEIVGFRIRAYESNFQNGVYVAAGDVTGDGLADIITSPGPGRNVHIRVWENESDTSSADPFDTLQWFGFRAFGDNIQTGATVAAGDLTGDGRAEIVVGSGPGIGARIRVYDISTIDPLPNPGFVSLLPFIREIRPFKSTDTGGVFVAVGNVRGSDTPEIIAGSGIGGRGRVEMFNADGTRFKSFNAYAVHVAVTNVDADAVGEVVTGEGPGGSLRRRAFDADLTLVDDILENDPDFRHGFFVA
jgi:hypothetical protein